MKDVNAPTLDGKAPEKEITERPLHFYGFNELIILGMVPLIFVCDCTIYVMIWKLPIEGGNVPHVLRFQNLRDILL